MMSLISRAPLLKSSSILNTFCKNTLLSIRKHCLFTPSSTNSMSFPLQHLISTCRCNFWQREAWQPNWQVSFSVAISQVERGFVLTVGYGHLSIQSFFFMKETLYRFSLFYSIATSASFCLGSPEPKHCETVIVNLVTKWPCLHFFSDFCDKILWQNQLPDQPKGLFGFTTLSPEDNLRPSGLPVKWDQVIPLLPNLLHDSCLIAFSKLQVWAGDAVQPVGCPVCKSTGSHP